MLLVGRSLKLCSLSHPWCYHLSCTCAVIRSAPFALNEWLPKHPGQSLGAEEILSPASLELHIVRRGLSGFLAGFSNE